MVTETFVFKSENNLFGDLVRGYIIYGTLILGAACLFKFGVDVIELNVFATQAFILIISSGLSYILLKNYVFSKRN